MARWQRIGGTSVNNNRVRADDLIEPGNNFIPFHFREAAANILTTDALDPYGKIPDFKSCAVNVEAADTHVARQP